MKITSLRLNINQFVCFAICLALMLVIPITRDHKILGMNIEKSTDNTDEKDVPLTHNPDGSITVNTTKIGNEIIGYGGPTPVEINVVDGKISKVKILPNNETPEYIGAVENSYLLDSLEGMTLKEAAEAKLDGVSGATYSSNAVIGNIKAGVNYAMNQSVSEQPAESPEHPLDAKWYVTIAVILCGAIIPLFLKSRGYRYVQLLLDVVILGFWGGIFLSYSIMVSALSNGLWRVILIPVALLLVTAFIYPMFGKMNHYCNWLCPYGAIQELASKCFPKKLAVKEKTSRYLTTARNILWFGLMWLLWTGIWFDWMGYEPFAAFFFNDASWVVLGIAGVFLVLSFFIQRPYCRFVCPTGTLFKLSEGQK